MTDTIAKNPHHISDSLWEKIEPLLPPELPRKGGRRRMDNRQAMEAIFYVFRTGSGWNGLPRRMGAKSTVRTRFHQWREAGLFQRMWLEGLLSYGEMKVFVWHGRRTSHKREESV